jgi:hypothetical protein
VVLPNLYGGLDGFIYSVWGSGWFYLFCVGVWVVLPNLCEAWVVLSILCGCLGAFIYSVWGFGWFYLICVGPG